jgi:hypothetical protein
MFQQQHNVTEKMKNVFTFVIILLALTACATPQTQTAQKSATPAMIVETITEVSSDEQASGGYMPSNATEEIVDWWGVIKSTEPGAQYDDYFERQDLGQIIYFGIDSTDPAMKSQIEALRDSGKIVHLYGTLLSNVPDYNGSQILVVRIEVKE